MDSNVVNVRCSREWIDSKRITLKQLLKKRDIADFFRFVDKHDLRSKALELIERELFQLSNH